MKNYKGWISRAFNLPILNRNRFLWVDYLRGLVILLVVYHHTYLGIQRSGIQVQASIADANMVFYSFRMPLFFIISGVFISRSLASKSIKELIGIKFEKIFYPYLIWAFLQTTLQIILSKFTNSERSLNDYLYILYQPRQLDQFWYLPALFNATLVFIFIKSKLKPKIGLHLLLALLFFFISPFLSGISMISDWMRFYLFFVMGDFISEFIFKKSVQRWVKNPITFLLFLPFFIVAQVYYLHNNIGKRIIDITPLEYFNADQTTYILYEVNFLFIAFIGCATLLILSFLLEKWNRLSFLRVLGFHSLYIYITHVIVVGFVRFLFTHVFHIYNPVIILVTGIAFGVTVPIVFYNLLGKSWLWFLFSPRKTEERVSLQQKQKTPGSLPAKT